MGVLRDMLADKLIDWAGDLIDNPEERETFAVGIVPFMAMRVARYERELAERRAKRAAKQ